MGYWSTPYVEVVITNATGPGPQAEHLPFSYQPDNKWQRKEANRLYEKFDVEYLGDWHSHPHSSADLSWEDMRTLRTISRYKNSRVKFPLMLIQHGQNNWKATAWKYSPNLWTRVFPIGHLTPMKIQITNEAL